ncbi:MAG: SET domain-containing protein-lysine N-methyltransferase [Candidatus Peregrinibacteria bacterium]
MPSDEKEEILRYGFQGDVDFYLAPKDSKSDAFLINHSCDPNCWYQDDFTITARRDIKPDEELTMDYATFMSPSGLEDEILFHCNCGTSLCRKLVKKDDCMIKEVQERYKNHFYSFIPRNYFKK